MKRSIVYIFILATGICFFISPHRYAFAQEAREVYESRCCLIYYSKAEHVNRFTLRTGGFRYTNKGLDNNPANVTFRVDEIMEKVKATLDMHPDDFRISILLYPDHQSMEKIFRQFTLTGTVPLAFYSHKTKSIYVNVDSVTDGVLAHEMAHAVINFYFKVPPPAKMQEILAQYVDLHIWD